MECYTYLRNVTDLLSDGKTPYERRFGQPFERPIIPLLSMVEYHPANFCQRLVKTPPVREESVARNIPGIRVVRRWSLER